MKVLFLYSEIAGYFLAGVKALVRNYGAEVHLVRWPLNSEAPFEFRELEGVVFYERREMDADDIYRLANKVNPDVVYVTGWMDKAYFKVARKLKKGGITVICAMDNQWKGTLKQRIATFISPLIFKTRYTHFWVPGQPQFEYARRLGYPENRIRKGMYTADTPPFEKAFNENFDLKKEKYPHTLLFVGRLVEHKGVQQLIEVFLELKKEIDNDWKLKVVGTGPLRGKLPLSDNIEYVDFVQPDQLPGLAAGAGALVLPSFEEPWGVVVHEFAAAGLPLILSDAVGAASAFLKPGENGFLHQAGDRDQLKSNLIQCMETEDDRLFEMGELSTWLAITISPETWAKTLNDIAQESKWP